MLLGLRARTKHCNARGLVHGAVLATLLATVCGWNCEALAPEGARVLTVNLNLDCLAPAHDGEWLEASASVTRVGRRLAFADGKVDAGGKPVAKASAVFAIP